MEKIITEVKFDTLICEGYKTNFSSPDFCPAASVDKICDSSDTDDIPEILGKNRRYNHKN